MLRIRKLFKEVRGIVVSNRQVALSLYRIDIRADTEVHIAGQFAMIGQYDSFGMNKPFSIFAQKDDILSFLVQKRGMATDRLTKMSLGSELRIISPLGNGFDHDNDAVLVAAGSAIAVFGDFIDKKNVTLFYGASTKDELIDIDADFYSTMDGSYGFKGNLVELFLSKKDIAKGRDIYIAGPTGFIKAFTTLIDASLADSCYASLETYMVCGVGACLGCTVDTINGYKRACIDGPVFPVRELLL